MTAFSSIKPYVALVITLFSLPLLAEPLTARQIMDKVDTRDDGNNAVMEMEMILIDKKGDQRTRALKSYQRDAGTDNKDKESVMFFMSPADVKDTGFLSYDFNDPAKDDDQWLYLPALKKTKRIASSDKSSSFMGTDFTYADMNKRHLDFYTFTIEKEDEVNGSKVWVIKSIPNNDKEKEETGYTQSVMFVRQDNFVVVRGINWVEKGARLKYMEVRDLKQVDGIWVSSEIVMTLKKDKETLHQTIMKSKNIQFNQPLNDDMFTVRTLEKGL